MFRGKIFSYTVIFEPAEEGGYVVHVPALGGLITQGETLEEARAMARDAIEGYLEVMKEDGEEIPVEHDELIISRVNAKAP